MGIKIYNQRGLSSDLLFVYDDLKYKGKQNHILASMGCRFIKKAVLYKFEMYNILNSYPIILPIGDSKYFIVGEIWSIGHAKIFDALDNIKSPMIRDIFEVESGKVFFSCWIYFMPRTSFNEDALGVKRNKEGKWKV